MKKVILTLSAALYSLFATAQPTHEFSINGGGGLSTLVYKITSSKKNLGFGGEVGLGYTCVFGEMAGIHVGADVSFYSVGATLNGIKIVTENLTDNEGDCFDLHTTLFDYKESQNAMFLNVPVMAYFQTKTNHKFYAMAGVKIGIPLSCKYKASDFALTNEAYYPEYDNWLTNQTFAGYGRFENINSEGKQKYRISAALSLETGMKWNIAEVFAMYTGVYFDYGLNNLVKKDDQLFVNYDNAAPSAFIVNSALAADKIHLMAVGVKVRLGFMK